MFREDGSMTLEWQRWFRWITDSVNSGSGISVSDAPYGSGWNGVSDVAPSLNAIYDKMQTLGGFYTHPVGDGNLHVPATGYINSGKVLTAGPSPGAISWQTPSGAFTVEDTASVNLTLTSSNVKADVLPGGVDHNSLLNYSADKHVDHTGVSILAGTGMSGGGTISENRTLNCSITQYTDALAQGACIAATAVNNDTTHAPCSDWILDNLSPIASPVFTGTLTAPIVKITTGAGANKFLMSDADGLASWENLATGGNVTTDTIWDAAGDLAVGTSANLGHKLSRGSEGKILTSSDSTVSWEPRYALLSIDFEECDFTSDFDSYYDMDFGKEFGVSDISVTDTSSVEISLVEFNITANVIPGGVDHNSLLNYVANRHIDHSGISILPGTGMSGGGDITSNRTLSCIISQYTDALARAACIAATAEQYDTTHAPCGAWVFNEISTLNAALLVFGAAFPSKWDRPTLTQDYIPYVIGSNSVMSDSPIMVDGYGIKITLPDGSAKSITLQCSHASGSSNVMFNNIAGLPVAVLGYANPSVEFGDLSDTMFFGTTALNKVLHLLSGGVTPRVTITPSGLVGINKTFPTAYLHLTKPTASYASARFEASAGVNVTSPNIGDMWFNGTNLYFKYSDAVPKDLLLGGGAPGGLDTHIQYNANGVLGGVAGLTWDGSQLQSNAAYHRHIDGRLTDFSGFDTLYLQYYANGKGVQIGDSGTDHTLTVRGKISNYVADGYASYMWKNQTLLTTTSPDYVLSNYLGHVIPTHRFNFTLNAVENQKIWYPTLYSVITVPYGKGGMKIGGSNAGGAQPVGLLVDVTCAGITQDLAAVFHAVVMNGQAAGQDCENASFGYSQVIGQPGQGLGDYYSSVVEGSQTFEACGNGSRGGRGWLHLLWVNDACAATGGPNPVNTNAGYVFIEAINGGIGGYLYPGYTNYAANRFLSCAGKWERVFGVDKNYSASPLTITECGLDLYTCVNYASATTPAIKLKLGNGIHFIGPSGLADRNVIRGDISNDALIFKVAGADLMLMYSAAIYINFGGTWRYVSRRSDGVVIAT
jgi:hypothetical protein